MGDLIPDRGQAGMLAAGVAAIFAVAAWRGAVHQAHAHAAEVLAVARDAGAAALAALAVLALLLTARWLSGREGWHCEAGPEPAARPRPQHRHHAGEPAHVIRLRPPAADDQEPAGMTARRKP